MRTAILIFSLLAFFSPELTAQQPKDSANSSDKDDVFALLDESATFPGGPAAFYKYVSKNLSYPKKAKRVGIKGRVYVEFFVGQDGSIDPETIRCPTADELAQFQLPTDDLVVDESCRKEAMRLIRKSPDWIPAKQKSVDVKQRMTIPIFFR